jgi:hypothetical protein
MQSEIQFAGFGGQGIMLMGQILAQAAMAGGKLSGSPPMALRCGGERHIVPWSSAIG